MELPGDFYHPSDGSVSGLHPSYSVSSQHGMVPGSGIQRYSTTSSTGSSPDVNRARWSAHESASSRPTSYASNAEGCGGAAAAAAPARSPALDQKAFAAELPTHTETAEEHVNRHALQMLEGRDGLPPYDPREYAAVPPVQTGGAPGYEKGGPQDMVPR